MSSYRNYRRTRIPEFPQDFSWRFSLNFCRNSVCFFSKVLGFLLIRFLPEFLGISNEFLPKFLAGFVPKIFQGFLRKTSRDVFQSSSRELSWTFSEVFSRSCSRFSSQHFARCSILNSVPDSWDFSSRFLELPSRILSAIFTVVPQDFFQSSFHSELVFLSGFLEGFLLGFLSRSSEISSGVFRRFLLDFLLRFPVRILPGISFRGSSWILLEIISGFILDFLPEFVSVFLPGFLLKFLLRFLNAFLAGFHSEFISGFLPGLSAGFAPKILRQFCQSFSWSPSRERLCVFFPWVPLSFCTVLLSKFLPQFLPGLLQWISLDSIRNSFWEFTRDYS